MVKLDLLRRPLHSTQMSSHCTAPETNILHQLDTTDKMNQ